MSGWFGFGGKSGEVRKSDDIIHKEDMDGYNDKDQTDDKDGKKSGKSDGSKDGKKDKR